MIGPAAILEGYEMAESLEDELEYDFRDITFHERVVPVYEAKGVTQAARKAGVRKAILKTVVGKSDSCEDSSSATVHKTISSMPQVIGVQFAKELGFGALRVSLSRSVSLLNLTIISNATNRLASTP